MIQMELYYFSLKMLSKLSFKFSPLLSSNFEQCSKKWKLWKQWEYWVLYLD